MSMGDGIVEPDFVDGEEFDEGEGEGDVDEGEMRKVVMGRVGGWVDWAVGWMDMRGEGEEGGEDDEEGMEDGGEDEEVREGGDVLVKGGLDPVELQKRLRRKKKRDEELESGGEGKGVGVGVGAPPEQAGVWSDAKWLIGVATKAAL